MSQITLRCISVSAAGTKFANLANPAESVTFKTTAQQRSRNNVQAVVGRSSIVWTTPHTVKQCDDACAPSGDFTDLLRLEFSNANSGALLIQRLRDVAAWVEAHPEFLQGFGPQQASDVVLGTV